MSKSKPISCSCQSQASDAEAEASFENIIRKVVSQSFHELDLESKREKRSAFEKDIYDLLQMQHFEFQNLRAEVRALARRGSPAEIFAQSKPVNASSSSGNVEACAQPLMLDSSAAELPADLGGGKDVPKNDANVSRLVVDRPGRPDEGVQINPMKLETQHSLAPLGSMDSMATRKNGGMSTWKSDSIMALCEINGWFTGVSGQLGRDNRIQVLEGLCALALIANSILVGWATDEQVQRCVEDPNQQSCADQGGYNTVEHVFTVFFLLEIVIRLGYERHLFFASDVRSWNIFELAVVLVSCTDMVMSVLGDSGATFAMNVSFIRVLRVLRLARIVKTIRVVRFFRELRVMIHSMLVCWNSLASALLLLALVTYVFAVFITQHTANFLADGTQGYNPDYWHDDMLDFVIIKFGTLTRTMLSLYEAVTGGISWGELCAALMSMSQSSTFFGIFFVGYTAFTGFALLNIVTGIFVDNAMKATVQDRDMVIHDEMAREGSYMNDIKRMFEEADVDHNGEITWTELQRYLEDARVKAYFNALEIHHSAARGLFRLLDTDGNGTVDCEEFVMGCARLKGGARSVDVATLLYENKKLKRELSTFHKQCTRELVDTLKVVNQEKDDLKDVLVHEEKVDEALIELNATEAKFEGEFEEMLLFNSSHNSRKSAGQEPLKSTI
eukprot:gnl/MRDRNA2_/MRDRNA2_16528_c0_seq1.p1 gnl/MRDRNA2_/MRDRNA2_16528_c0~~gnl/MRDRNA2_/MRDRNA2_16528_c0_seq1.p1  ORF type:complete len:672 (-),score=124.25 gnl/MRDRNA2_/MRDRNA2_16528_c0_seq1:421-2436(-)